mgnify:CR=1 FL=1
MTELCSAEFLKLSLQEVADMMVGKLDDQDSCKAVCFGCCDGRMFSLELVMKEVDKDGN